MDINLLVASHLRKENQIAWHAEEIRLLDLSWAVKAISRAKVIIFAARKNTASVTLQVPAE